MYRVLTIALMLVAGGSAFAGPFSRRTSTGPPTCQGGRCLALPLIDSQPAEQSQRVTTPSQESPPEGPPVPQPWLLTSEADDSYSQPPDTVLEPVQGTGSKLGIGPKLPDKITHTLDPASLEKLKEMLKAALPSGSQPVAISLPVAEETSQRLSRISMILEWLLWLGGAYFGLSKTGGALQWVVRVANGLPSAIQAASLPPQQTAAATSSAPTNPLPAGSQAAPASTPKPVI